VSVPRLSTLLGIFAVTAILTAVTAFLLWLLADNPLAYLEAKGLRANASTPLLWGTICVSLGVMYFFIVTLLAAIYRGRRGGFQFHDIARPPGGMAWIFTGVGVSTLLLLGTTIWTVGVLSANSAPPRTAAVKIAVIGHQWWWEVRYLSDSDPSRGFKTANEIHIPAGEPVEISLQAADVIHSFWIPKLAGKTDLIPGQINKTWIEADKPGVFLGRCGEYCGLQHAHMAMTVVADTPERFNAWRDHQLASQPPPVTENAIAAQSAFIQKCGACHAVRGTSAFGILGPDLSHLMTRAAIAAGTLPNTQGHLSGWIADPQSVKPGAYMPRLDLSGPELNRVGAFLKTLN
jgi:cytochrome c oxidase subunit II